MRARGRLGPRSITQIRKVALYSPVEVVTMFLLDGASVARAWRISALRINNGEGTGVVNFLYMGLFLGFARKRSEVPAYSARRAGDRPKGHSIRKIR
jgi:hypothetical protein